MSVFQGFLIIKIDDQSVVASRLRLSEARRKVEELNKTGHRYKIQEDWHGAPVSTIHLISNKAYKS